MRTMSSSSFSSAAAHTAVLAANACISHCMRLNQQGGTLETHIQSAVNLSQRINTQVILGFSTHAAVHTYGDNHYPLKLSEKTKKSTAAFHVEQLNIESSPVFFIILHMIPLTTQASPSQTPLKRSPYHFETVDACVAFIHGLKMSHIYLDMNKDFEN